MELMIVFFVLILLIYSYFIIKLIIGFDKIKIFTAVDKSPKTTFSIVVPFRNEEKKLPHLLKSLSKLNYPKDLFEIIVIDDNSRDKSALIFNEWRMKNGLIQTTLLNNLRLSNSPKKDAINRAVPVVKNEWIITTDADCVVKKNWLSTLDNFIQKNNPEMVVGGVIYKTKNNWFHQFQQLDLLSLQATTIGSFGIKKPFMCNGANFAYTKELFQKIGGFNIDNAIASGDDVFLLQKAVAKFPEKVHYLKNIEATVTTNPENNLYKLFMQRVRWASKTTSYSNSYAKALAVVVLLMNLSLVAGFVLFLFSAIYWKVLICLFFVKFILDYILLLKSATFFTKNKLLFVFASSFIYPVFVSVVGIYSLVGNYTWKGRVFKK
jgi:cellulose synthase/poly-beta-1,6-N-acetylglucosamine synthase-like glycosyltransferase